MTLPTTGERVSNTVQEYRGVQLGWSAGDGHALRAFVDGLPDHERATLQAVQLDDYLPNGGYAAVALWTHLPPWRFRDRQAPKIGDMYPTMLKPSDIPEFTPPAPAAVPRPGDER